MEITRELRNELFHQIKPIQVYLYSSPISGGVLLSIAQKHQLSEISNYKKFAVIIGDIVLGFYKIEDTVPLLQQELEIDAKTAALLGADVLDFLAPLSDPNFVVPVDANEDDKSPEIDPVTPVSNTWNPALITSQPAPTAHAPIPMQSIAPEIHTMASDANAARTHFEPVSEPVYSSEQPMIQKTLSDTPSYASPFDQAPRDTTPKAPIEPPRWGS